MVMNCPRLVVAGLSGDSGKTITSLSLLTALRSKQLTVSVFKKGPDYIDAAWLSWAAGTACRNLDTYMVGSDNVLGAFTAATSGDTDIAIIEGNRGLFDGKDSQGTHSTANLARLLKAPVVLIVNCTKITRTAAALVKGCQTFEPDVNLAGVILNQVAGERHRRVIIESIEQSCDLPVLGAIPRLHKGTALIPGRHLGLVTPAEFAEDLELKQRLLSIAEQYLNVDQLIEIARQAEPLPESKFVTPTVFDKQARIGFFQDSVFTFYYPENLEALEAAGAELVPVSSLDDSRLPEIDGLYIGGGFPETHAERLSQNKSMLESVRQAAENDLPIYAECGGLIFLCRSLACNGQRYPMAGLFPIDLKMYRKPVGHGYTETTVERANPFFEVGAVIRGHEFHYSGPTESLSDQQGCLRVTVGVGLGNGRDGLLYKNCLACYTHIHAAGVPGWATALVSRATEFRASVSGEARGNKAETVQYEPGKPVNDLELISQPEARIIAQASN